MPVEKILSNRMPLAHDNETVLAKSRGVWHQVDIIETIRRHRELLPEVKMIMMVRDPIHRYVSDLVHFNKRQEKYGRETYSDFDGIVSGRVNPGRYFEYNGKYRVFQNYLKYFKCFYKPLKGTVSSIGAP